MLYPMAIETGIKGAAYGVVFPDLPGCFSAGDTLDEAVKQARDAVDFYLEDLADDGKLPPIAGDLAKWQSKSEFKGWSWAVIDVDIEPYLGRAIKKNVTIPNLLLKKIDDAVKADANYSDRSHFIQVAAINELKQRAY